MREEHLKNVQISWSRLPQFYSKWYETAKKEEDDGDGDVFWVSARIHHSDAQDFIYLRAGTTLYFAVDSLQKKLRRSLEDFKSTAPEDQSFGLCCCFTLWELLVIIFPR